MLKELSKLSIPPLKSPIWTRTIPTSSVFWVPTWPALDYPHPPARQSAFGNRNNSKRPKAPNLAQKARGGGENVPTDYTNVSLVDFPPPPGRPQVIAIGSDKATIEWRPSMADP